LTSSELCMSKAFSSPAAHLERLRELLKWAWLDDNLQKQIKEGHDQKANRLLIAGCTQLFGTTPPSKKYAKIILAKLKIQNDEYIWTEWGPL